MKARQAKSTEKIRAEIAREIKQINDQIERLRLVAQNSSAATDAPASTEQPASATAPVVRERALVND
jgi:hypothetical protein